MSVVLGIEYDGSDFSGWQWQDGCRTVQGELQQSLAAVANHCISLHCAGRTDAGVHANCQVVHFASTAPRTMANWVRGGNRHLPATVRILWAMPKPPDFHARYSAIARYYRYEILNRPVASVWRTAFATRLPLDAETMNTAAQFLVGEHDFSSFRAAGCGSKSPRRVLHYIKVARCGEKIAVDIIANAFLHKMVRNIIGCLLTVGSGKQSADFVAHTLALQDRTKAPATAPAQGLYLAGVYYPPKYNITSHPIFQNLSDAKRWEY